VHDEVVFPEDKQEAMLEILAEAFKWTFKDAGNFGQLTLRESRLERESATIQLEIKTTGG